MGEVLAAAKCWWKMALAGLSFFACRGVKLSPFLLPMADTNGVGME